MGSSSEPCGEATAHCRVLLSLPEQEVGGEAVPPGGQAGGGFSWGHKMF